MFWKNLAIGKEEELSNTRDSQDIVPFRPPFVKETPKEIEAPCYLLPEAALCAKCDEENLSKFACTCFGQTTPSPNYVSTKWMVPCVKITLFLQFPTSVSRPDKSR